MKIICVGRNYAAHAAELGNEVPTSPVIFFKPDTAVLRNNQPFFYPEYSEDIHYECEIVYRIGKEGKYVQREFARNYLDGVGLGIDFTARDLQNVAKSGGLPWTLAKGFNDSAPVSNFEPLENYPDLSQLKFELKVNQETRQQGDASLMLWPIEPLIEYITRFITLKKGDLVFTGTPAGVGPVHKGDRLQGYLEGKEMFHFLVK
ncbi:MAG: fumarylacetoacetate hydrolase family protein [Bacteroidia bacterium]|nr:fumarylacetoacetate hydrolase family protein [Bacteroidia bacterium]